MPSKRVRDQEMGQDSNDLKPIAPVPSKAKEKSSGISTISNGLDEMSTNHVENASNGRHTNYTEADQANFFVSNLNSRAIAVRIKELDECCCAHVPCVSIVKEYCESSSLHGLRYITEDGRHWSERVLWVLLCLCGFFLTVYFIYPIWSKWNEKPTLTTLDSTDYPVWSIDFPAVTICPANRINRIKLNQIRNEQPWNSLADDVMEKLIEFLFESKGLGSPEEGVGDTLETMGLQNLTNLAVRVMFDCSSIILACMWRGHWLHNCDELFQMRKSNDGFCCSFNSVHPKHLIDTTLIQDLIERNELKESKSKEAFAEFNTSENEGEPIRRLNSANFWRGLSMVVDTKADDVLYSADNFLGVKLLIHGPEAYPEVESNLVVVGPGQEAFVSVSASKTDGSKTVLDFPFEGRSCLFEDERDFPMAEVTMFKSYTQENCMMECRSKLLLARCGCLPFFYPRLDLILKHTDENFRFLNNVTACSKRRQWRCLANSTDILDSVYPYSGDPVLMNATSLMSGAKCDCPPACSRTSYSTRVSSAPFPNPAAKIKDRIRLSKDQRESDLSLVHVYFNDLKVFKYHTDELFSWENILASFGGLVGLCTGFSFLSAAEFVYFFTLRCALPLCRKPTRKRTDKVAMINDNELVVVKVED